LRRSGLRPPDEYLNGQFFRPRRVKNNPENSAGHALILGAKNRLKIRIFRFDANVGTCFARCIHTHYNVCHPEFVTAGLTFIAPPAAKFPPQSFH
jgi:hypothetical protein